MPIGKLSARSRNRTGDVYTTVRLEGDLRRQIEVYCKATGATVAGVVNKALRAYLVNHFAQHPPAP